MLSLALFALSLASGPYRNLNTCETYAPRIDGTQVTVCRGAVVRTTMAPRVMVLAIEGPIALVMSELGSEWTIAASRLPEGTTAGDYVLLGDGGSMRSPRTVVDADLADVYDPMNPSPLLSTYAVKGVQ